MIGSLKECRIATLKQSTEHILDLDLNEYLIELELEMSRNQNQIDVLL